MTIEQFKNNWQPQMNGYATFCFNLDLKELKQQIRKDVIDEIIKTLAESEDTILSVIQYYTLIGLKEDNNG